MDEMASYWTQYWQGGAKSTLSDIDKSAYGIEVSNKWSESIKEFCQQGAVLDLACGNGDLAVQACNVLQALDKHNDVYANDYSEIMLDKKVQGEFALKKVKWIPSTDAVNLPIESNCLSLAVSQFGFEYTNTNLVIQELSRVIYDNGHLCFLVHHDDSFICKQSKKEFKMYQDMLNVTKIYDATKNLLLELKITKETAITEKLRTTLNNKLGHLYDNYDDKSGLFELINLLKKLLANIESISIDEIESSISTLERQSMAHFKRLEHMISVSFSRETIEQLMLEFKKSNFMQVKLEELTTSVGLLGWWIIVKKQS
ncbi:class I SAM-dependent methyltransferase [Pseudoalteromonas denitrificans]|uniref:UbiE/COQ5 methyltransferase family protein n=1 Tax=Pseudoalteromonas denitrificans DSM 6059 TaxID=1123010 RepID=A0A1I1I7R0_9GAMM|nr:class I SAM-dependent methyltransferase [Pseudoalteromonas denitrificans]SFC29813.1 ubiE/COQ5 methyltransferase family protein [Pseudoalteromonas denitrificans DSM 6059]